MTIPIDPEIGRLYQIDDEDGINCFEIDCSEYNSYIENDLYRLTFYCSAKTKISPDNLHNPEPWVELNLKSDSDFSEMLVAGSRLVVPSYDESTQENLTNMYYFYHLGFEKAEIRILDVGSKSITATILGEHDDSPVLLKAVFNHNLNRKPTFA